MRMNFANIISDVRFPNSKYSQGFTILELTLGIGIFVIIAWGLGALAQLYISFGDIMPGQKLESEVSRVHFLTIEDLKRSIRQAESVLASTVVEGVTYTTATTTLVLRVRSIDASQNIISGSYDTFIYSTNTTTPPIKLSKRIVPAASSARPPSNIVLNDSVQSISFTYNSTTTSDITKIQVSLTTEKESGAISRGASSTIAITLR